MHFLVAPTDTPLHGFTRAVITTVMELLFADPATRRVVVEPDVRNRPVHALNAAVGFRVQATVALPGKEALLSTCTRDEWDRANRLLVRKALAEFSHERLLTPEPRPGGTYAVRSDDGTVEYRFAARRLALDH